MPDFQKLSPVHISKDCCQAREAQVHDCFALHLSDNLPIRHPALEEYNRAVRMDSRYVEMTGVGEPTQPLTPTSSSTHPQWDNSPAMTMSSDTPLSASMTPVEQADGSFTEMQSPSPVRDSTGTYTSNGGHCSSKQYIRRSLPILGQFPYELEATVSSKTIANREFTAYQPGSASQGSFDKCYDLRKRQADSIPSLSTARPKPVKNMEATPATAIHHSKTSDTINKKRRSADKESGSDPFLGTGKPVKRLLTIDSARRRTIPTELSSPSPARLRGTQLGGTPGLLSLHDVHDEVNSLLDTLKITQRIQMKNEVDVALSRCQEDLKTRSKDKTMGTAEANILDREAARIGRARDEASKRAQEADAVLGTEEDPDLEENLRLALTRLIEDARAAIDSVAQAKSQAASASRAKGGYVPYRAAEDFRLAALHLENRKLREQMKRIQAEQEQVHRESSDLQRRLEELKLRDEPCEPIETKLGPWGKDWNLESKKGG